MVHLTKRFALTALAALALAAVTQPADARSVVGYSGKPLFPTDISCFAEAWGAVINNCGGDARPWFIPLTADNYSSSSTVVTAYRPSPGSNIGCGTISINKEATGIWGNSIQYLSTFGTYADINVPAVYVPPGGSQFAFCWMNQGSKISIVNTSW